MPNVNLVLMVQYQGVCNICRKVNLQKAIAQQLNKTNPMLLKRHFSNDMKDISNDIKDFLSLFSLEDSWRHITNKWLHEILPILQGRAFLNSIRIFTKADLYKLIFWVFRIIQNLNYSKLKLYYTNTRQNTWSSFTSIMPLYCFYHATSNWEEKSISI